MAFSMSGWHDSEVMTIVPFSVKMAILAVVPVLWFGCRSYEDEARSRSPTNFFDASQSIEENVHRDDHIFHRQVIPKEVPLTSCRNTTSVSWIEVLP